MTCVSDWRLIEYLLHIIEVDHVVQGVDNHLVFLDHYRAAALVRTAGVPEILRVVLIVHTSIEHLFCFPKAF